MHQAIILLQSLSVLFNLPEWNIIVSDFELLSHYYIHFQNNTKKNL